MVERSPSTCFGAGPRRMTQSLEGEYQRAPWVVTAAPRKGSRRSPGKGYGNLEQAAGMRPPSGVNR